MSRFQKYHLKWPWTATQVNNLDDMLGDLFKALAQLTTSTSSSSSSAAASSSEPTIIIQSGYNGEDGADSYVPGPAGATGATGATGASGSTTVGVSVDNGTSDVTVGSKGYRRVFTSGTIRGVTILAYQSGSIQFDVKKSTFAGFPTTASIVAAAPPQLVAAQSSSDTTLTGWTTAVTAGDVLEFLVTSVTGIKKVTLELDIQ